MVPAAGPTASAGTETPSSADRSDDDALSRVIDAWASLPTPIRAGIIALVDAAELHTLGT